jgi:hypothetical protein
MQAHPAEVARNRIRANAIRAGLISNNILRRRTMPRGCTLGAPNGARARGLQR